jgi:hypothetical protein
VSRRQVGELALALAVFALGTALYLGPSIPSIGGHLGPDLGDPRLNLYFVSWAAHALDRGFDGLWSPPFFHPTPGVLAYSDHLIGPGVVLRLAGLAGVGPVTAFNLLFLATFVLSGAVTFAVFRRLGLGLWPALLAGWFVAFSHARWYEVSHYQVLRAQWMPAVLYTFDRFLARPRAASAAAFLAFYLLHVSGGTYLAYMIHLPMAAALAVRLRERGWREFFADGRTPWLAGVGAAAMALLAPFVWGYLAEWGSRTTSRQLWEIRDAGALLTSFFSPSHDALVRSLGIFADYRDRGALFPGLVLLAGCVALALARGRAVGEADRGRRRRVAGLAGLGVAVTLWGLGLADAFTLDRYEAPWLEALGLRRYNGPRLLAVAGIALIFLAWRRWPGRAAAPVPTAATRDPFVAGLLAGGALCLWLALPVGFTTLSRQLPGMSGMRVSHRFFVFAMLALAYLAARGLESVRVRLAGRGVRAAFVVLVSAAVVVEATPRRWEWAPVPERPDDFPAAARFLASAAGVGAYVEVPLHADWRETERMHHQTLHWKPMINGYSARFAPSYERLATQFAPLPDRAGLARLREIGVTHLVVHLRNELPGRRAINRQLALAANAAIRRGELALELADEAAGTSVLRIVAAPAAAARRGDTP